MIGYALLTALKLEYGFRVFMESKDLKKLSYYFKNIDQVESLNRLCDEENSYPWLDSYRNQNINIYDFPYGKYENFTTGKLINHMNGVRSLCICFLSNVYFSVAYTNFSMLK